MIGEPMRAPIRRRRRSTVPAGPRARARVVFISALVAAVGLAIPVQAAPLLLRPQYRVDATLAPGKPQIEGTVDVAFTNRSSQTVREAVLFLFPNRFSEVDTHINDFYRQYLYPDKELPTHRRYCHHQDRKRLDCE